MILWDRENWRKRLSTSCSAIDNEVNVMVRELELYDVTIRVRSLGQLTKVEMQSGSNFYSEEGDNTYICLQKCAERVAKDLKK